MLGRSREFAAAGAWFVYENNGVEILESKGPIRTKLKVEVNESLLSLLNIIDRKFVFFFCFQGFAKKFWIKYNVFFLLYRCSQGTGTRMLPMTINI